MCTTDAVKPRGFVDASKPWALNQEERAVGSTTLTDPTTNSIDWTPLNESLRGVIRDWVRQGEGTDGADEAARRARYLREFQAWQHVEDHARILRDSAAENYADYNDRPYPALGAAIGIDRQAMRKQLPTLAGRATARRARDAWMADHGQQVQNHAEDLVRTYRESPAAGQRGTAIEEIGNWLRWSDPLDPGTLTVVLGEAREAAADAEAGTVDPETEQGIHLLWLDCLAVDFNAHKPTAEPVDRGRPCRGTPNCPRPVQARVISADLDNDDRCLEHAAEHLRAGGRLLGADPGVALTAMKIAFAEQANTVEHAATG